LLSAALLAAGLIALAVAFAASYERARQDVTPGAGWLALSTVLMAGGLRCFAQGWVAVVDGRGDPAGLRRGWYAAQLGKYVPGGIWQPAAQVATSDLGPRRGSAAFLSWAGCYAVAGAVLGGLGIALWGAGWRRLGAVGLLAPVALALLLLRGRGPILRPTAWMGAGLVLHALAYGLLLRSIGGPLGLGAASFCLAWLAGFLAVPVPSGLAVREAVLVALIGGPAAPVIAASVAQRLTGMAAEVALIATSRLIRPKSVHEVQ
jgi:hypothetical protein